MIFIIPQLKKKHARPGVYRIVFDDKWVYIGSSVNVSNRIRRWHSCINGNIHLKSINMKMILPKCKEVRFEILCHTETADLALQKEGQLLKTYENYEFLLNRCPDPTTTKGIKPYIGQTIFEKKAHLPRSAYYKPVAKFNMNGQFIVKYESVKAAAIAHGSNPKKISSAIREQRGSHKGYVFKYIKQDGSFEEPTYRKRDYKVKRPHKKFPGRKILQLDSNGNILNEHYGLVNAAKAVGLNSGATIHAAITRKKHTAAGFYWEYASKG